MSHLFIHTPTQRVKSITDWAHLWKELRDSVVCAYSLKCLMCSVYRKSYNWFFSLALLPCRVTLAFAECVCVLYTWVCILVYVCIYIYIRIKNTYMLQVQRWSILSSNMIKKLAENIHVSCLNEYGIEWQGQTRNRLIAQ